jgi:hypothetical protein
VSPQDTAQRGECAVITYKLIRYDVSG